MKHAMQTLQEAAKKYGPLCVGLDTDPSYIPENIVKNYSSSAEAVLAFNLALIERIKKDQSACCFKIQIAYYEAMGLEGMNVYAKTVKAVRDAGFIAISDIKRGDIAASAEAYARGHFTGDFETDIITINPYMGFDTLKPYTKYSAPDYSGKGAFVLLCTSNPGMTDIEHQKLAEGGLLLERVGDEIARIGKEWGETCPDYKDQTCGIFGAVVGATQEADARWLRDKYPETFFLIPGYGAQGGAAKICAILLEKCGGVVNSSRGILCAWKKDPALEEKRNADNLKMEDLIEASAKAALASKEELMSF
ncbi:MAG: orotidine-5'-phosphate decarboxylase [Treponema sp.]|uniref:orotidine-5'-phosphate decarboxylase n=1 Tax=Treponema sp. TaxID=166 RepID=UPI001B41297E|nr:orotidine-5'-phosphate decarboxylase [Treponema sp.]MBP5402621.1 orotidine-5'-phosphate decarboxylase [Treponema sp.]MBR5933797.1 orotidine-5'-phosphate decarboxylase [Treponema sp.]